MLAPAERPYFCVGKRDLESILFEYFLGPKLHPSVKFELDANKNCGKPAWRDSIGSLWKERYYSAIGWVSISSVLTHFKTDS
jgi:hypothetical protein